MTYYLDFDEKNVLCGRYESALHKSIPATAVAVDEGLFNRTLREKDGIFSIDRLTGEIVKLPLPAVSLDALKAQKQRDIRARCEALLNGSVFDYPESEIRTFTQQAAEARAFFADAEREPPLLSMMAATRGISLAEQARKVLEKQAAFSRLCGYVIGLRQSLEAALAACDTVEAVEALDITVSLPDEDNGITPCETWPFLTKGACAARGEDACGCAGVCNDEVVAVAAEAACTFSRLADDVIEADLMAEDPLYGRTVRQQVAGTQEPSRGQVAGRQALQSAALFSGGGVARKPVPAASEEKPRRLPALFLRKKTPEESL